MTDRAQLEQQSLQTLKDPDQNTVDWSSFAKDESYLVRHGTVSHAKCPIETLHIMLEDAEPCIRDIAQQRLQIKGMLERTPVAK